MNLQFIPKYDRSAASSRIRVYMLAEEIARQELADVSVIEPGGSPLSLIRPDVIVVQKRDLTGVHQTQSPTLTTIVFDYDDHLPQLLDPAGRVCKGLTVDTRRRLDAVFPIAFDLKHPLAHPDNQKVLKWLDRGYPRGFVLPDCIDYAPAAPMPATELLGGLAWFGNFGNFNCKTIADAWEGPVGIISDRAPEPLSNEWLFVPWYYESFPRTLREFGVAMLSHYGQDQAKSNNKLIAAVTLGVPVIVGAGSPAYEELLRECDLGAFICRVPQDVRDCMRELRTQAGRQAYLDRIQGTVWERYRVEKVAQQAMNIYREVSL